MMLSSRLAGYRLFHMQATTVPAEGQYRSLFGSALVVGVVNDPVYSERDKYMHSSEGMSFNHGNVWRQ